MKKRHIAAGLIVLSLVAVTFVGIAAAVVYYPPLMTVVRAGKNFTFTVNTSTASTRLPDPSDTISNFGEFVDTSTILITIYDAKGNTIEIDPDWTAIAVNPDGSEIAIQLVKQDGIPIHAIAINVQADLMGPYEGNQLFASGPGWGWGGHY